MPETTAAPAHAGTASSSFYEVAAQDPDRVALLTADHAPVTFGRLLVAANRVANGLRALGLRDGDRVAALMRNRVEFVELLLASMQIGLRFVPINWHLTAGEVGYVVADSGAKVVVADPEFAATLPVPLPHGTDGATSGPVGWFATDAGSTGWRRFAELDAAPSADAPTDRVAGGLMGYTSGTTGRPKGVARSLTGLTPEQAPFGTLLAQFGITGPAGVHLACSPLYHSAPLGFTLASLSLGHSVVLLDGFDPEAVLAMVQRHRVTHTHMVPIHLNRIMRLPEEVRARYDVSSLRTLVHAGAPCPLDLKKAVVAWLGPIVWEYLGATEGIAAVSSPEDFAHRPGAVGKVPPGRVQVLDDDGQPVTPGEVGRIFFRGPAFEYHNDRGKTDENRVGEFVTVGDLGTLDEEGYLTLLDRRTDLIVSGGVNIYPAEIESYLSAHPGVSDVCVIGVPDPEWGQSVLAVVVPEPGQGGADLVADLADFAKVGLGSHKRPRGFEIRAALPRLATGKLLRREVRAEFVPEA